MSPATCSLSATSWLPGMILSSMSLIWLEEKPSQESPAEWRLNQTEINHHHTLLCLLPLMSSTDSNSWRSQLSTLDLEPEEEMEIKLLDQAPNLPLELLPVMALKSEELRMWPQFQLIPQEEDAEKVADFDLFCAYHQYLLFYYKTFFGINKIESIVKIFIFESASFVWTLIL